jgi:hypothetical protein
MAFGKYGTHSTRTMQITEAEFTAIVREAVARPSRLTGWEQGFMASMSGHLARNGDTSTPSLTDRQISTLRKIEAKVFKGG